MARKAKGSGPGLLQRQAAIRGLLGGSRPWLILWAVLAARRGLKRLLGDRPEILQTVRLEEGQAVVVSTREREPRVISPT
jgi:hypothetical protein